VVVLGSEGAVEIYGYPREVFPPTDSHTATLVGERIYLIGRLGYRSERLPGITPVYVLDTDTYAIVEVKTVGNAPGWIFGHSAELDDDAVITVRGGEIIGEQFSRQNFDDYVFETQTGVWRRLTNRNWQQFRIRQQDGQLFALERAPDIDELLPQRASSVVQPIDDVVGWRFEIEGVTVSLRSRCSAIELVIEGDLPANHSHAIAEEVRGKAEAAINCPCVLHCVS
jgi:hypothetical protein